MNTRRRTHLVAGLAGAAALLLVGLAALIGPAQATGSRERVEPVRGVQVQRFVTRDADGQVAARGATATLPGHAPTVLDPAVSASSRVATVRRGHHVAVRHVGSDPARRPVTATR